MQAASQLHVRTHYNAGATADSVLAAYEALLAAAQPFPWVEDMMDFEGDPLEIATPDARNLSPIESERQRRAQEREAMTLRKGALRESSAAIRTALRDMEHDGTLQSPAARLANRLEAKMAPKPQPSFAKTSHFPRYQNPIPQPQPTSPTHLAPPKDVIPPHVLLSLCSNSLKNPAVL